MADAKTKEDLVYHYCDTAAFMSVVANERIWCSSAEFMNDTLDCHIFDDIVEDWVKVDKKLSAPAREAIRRLYLARHYGFVPFVSCFSFGRDLLSQWRGYANDGKGFAIGFSKKELIAFFRGLQNADAKNAITTQISAKNVIYNNSNLKAKVHAQLAKLRDDPSDTAGEGEKKKARNANLTILRQLRIDSAFYKQKTFSEEKEFRVAVLSDYGSHSPESASSRVISSIKFRKSPAELIVAYFEVFFPKPREIIIGPKNAASVEQVLYFLNNCKYGRTSGWPQFLKEQIRISALTLR